MNKCKNGGFVLPTGMVFLFLLSLLSLNSLQIAVMQQKITRNQDDTLLSFERAESALAEIENSDLVWDMSQIRNVPGYHNTFSDPLNAPNFHNYDWNDIDKGFHVSFPEVHQSPITQHLPKPVVVFEELYFSEIHSELKVV